MGLDCYVYAKPSPNSELSTELWYGRKTNEIHGFFQHYFDGDNDNCVELPLDDEMLDELMELATRGELAPTSGFFFGGGNDQDYLIRTVSELVTNAKKALADGDYVFYYAWY